MAVVIGINSAAITAQQGLAKASEQLGKSFERLSSGMRINSSADDSAGIAVADSLRADVRIYSQGIRNFSDGVSLLNLAEGALRELANITCRQLELAEEAANGTYSPQQRKVLDLEANALVNEFNRITSTTTFNGINVFDTSSTGIRLQGGYGLNGSISFSTTDDFDRTVGTGTFADRVSYACGSNVTGAASGDINGDGKLDVVTAANGTNTINILLGNGNGTFAAFTQISLGYAPFDMQLVDVNNDNVLDIVGTTGSTSATMVALGNGNGTFRNIVSYSTNANARSVTAADVNNDGYRDLIVACTNDDAINIFLNAGNGTFGSRMSFAAGDAPQRVATGDFDGNGTVDIAAASGTDSRLTLYLGAGNGSFTAKISYIAGSSAQSVRIADIDHDGNQDFIVGTNGDSKTMIFFGDGKGTSRASVSFVGGTANGIADLNGDGYYDIVAANPGNDYLNIYLGNGNGTFGTALSIYGGDGPHATMLEDFNRDGVADIVVIGQYENRLNTFIANNHQTVQMAQLNLLTQEDARSSLSTIQSTLLRVDAALGSLGAAQSRIQCAIGVMSSTVLTSQAAESRIRDADIADESSKLLSAQIRQQIASSVLGQANIAPRLALTLLNGKG